MDSGYGPDVGQPEAEVRQNPPDDLGVLDGGNDPHPVPGTTTDRGGAFRTPSGSNGTGSVRHAATFPLRRSGRPVFGCQGNATLHPPEDAVLEEYESSDGRDHDPIEQIAVPLGEGEPRIDPLEVCVCTDLSKGGNGYLVKPLFQ